MWTLSLQWPDPVADSRQVKRSRSLDAIFMKSSSTCRAKFDFRCHRIFFFFLNFRSHPLCTAPQVLEVRELPVDILGRKGWHGSDPTKSPLYFTHWFLTQWKRRAKQSARKARGFVSTENTRYGPRSLCESSSDFLASSLTEDRSPFRVVGWMERRWRGITKVSVLRSPPRASAFLLWAFQQERLRSLRRRPSCPDRLGLQ